MEGYGKLMDNTFYLGKGMKFPPQINPATGRFLCVEGNEGVKESIYLILMTHKTERKLRPDYGCNAASYVFNSVDATILSMMARELEDDILHNEPRISRVDVRMDQDTKPGCLFIYIDYYIRNGNVRENMVFPFYLGEEPATEEEAYETMEDDVVE